MDMFINLCNVNFYNAESYVEKRFGMMHTYDKLDKLIYLSELVNGGNTYFMGDNGYCCIIAVDSVNDEALKLYNVAKGLGYRVYYLIFSLNGIKQYYFTPQRRKENG